MSSSLNNDAGFYPLKMQARETWYSYMIIALMVFGLSALAIHVSAGELKSTYAVIQYGNIQQLRDFNNKIYLGGAMAYELRQRRTFTVQDEVAAKFDIVTEKVQQVVDMHPKKLQYRVHLFTAAKDARQALFERYHKKVKFISFYSRRDNLVYLSVKDARLQILAHELGHVVVEHYFKRSPPVRMHEIMAQYAEKHITD